MVVEWKLESDWNFHAEPRMLGLSLTLTQNEVILRSTRKQIRKWRGLIESLYCIKGTINTCVRDFYAEIMSH